jgi:hypothetical protein
MSRFTNLSNNKIGNSTGKMECFPNFPCFLALISWILFFESLEDPS